MKERIDLYLNENFDRIENWRVGNVLYCPIYKETQDKKEGQFGWEKVKKGFEDWYSLNYKNNVSDLDLLTSEKIRKRFRVLREKNVFSSIKNSPKENGEFKLISGKDCPLQGVKEFCFSASRIPTDEEIIDHFNIDIIKYRISQIWHKTTPGGKYSISVNLQANKGNETINLNEEFILKLNNLQSIEQLHLPIITDKPKACLVIPKQDAHWDKFDIDGNNSIEDRFAIFTKTMLYQLEKVLKTNTLEKIIYIVGSDEFNSEWTGATTKFTPQQNTMSYQKAFEKISEFSIEFIKLLRFYTQKIEVVLLNGNHDHNVSWHLANLLKHVFSKNESITIDTELNNTKIVEYSSSLILLNHGDEMKPKDLATKFPIIAKDKWSKFDNYFVLSGDKHHEQAYDYNGIRTYQVPQLSKAKSLWDDKKGHLCSKAELVTFLFEEDGLSNILRKEIK